MDNDRIIKLLFDRDEGALSEIQTKLGNLLKTVALNIYRSDGVAEECLNDTLMAIWDSIPPDKPKSIMAYACAIMRRKTINRVKHETAKKRAIPEAAGYDDVMDDLGFVEGIESEIVGKIELSNIINRFLGNLSSTNRGIFMGRYFGYESVDSIASRLNISANAVKIRLVRMKKELKEELEKGGFDL